MPSRFQIAGTIAIIFILVFISEIGVSQNQQIDWTKGIGSFTNEYCHSIVSDHSGVIMVGQFSGHLDFDPDTGVTLASAFYGGQDIFVLKLDSLGHFKWIKSIGSQRDDAPTDSKLDSQGNIYLVGSYYDTCDFDPGAPQTNVASRGREDCFLVKLDQNGNLLWYKTFGGRLKDVAYSLDLDAVGNIYITGTFQDSVDFDPGAGFHTLHSNGFDDVFLLKLDKNGAFKWAKVLGGPRFDHGEEIVVDPNGLVYLTGNFEDTVDFDPSSNTDFKISNAFLDIFVSQFDSLGNYIWSKHFGGPDNDYSGGISTKRGDGVFLSGSFHTSADFDPDIGVNLISSVGSWDPFVLRLSDSGNVDWVRTFGSTRQDYAYAIDSDANGVNYTIGLYQSIVDFDPGSAVFNISNSLFDNNVFVEKLDNNGNFVWAKSIGSRNIDRGRDINLLDSNVVYATGTYADDLGFKPYNLMDSLPHNRADDIFIQRLTNCDTLVSIDSRSACDSLIWYNGIKYKSSSAGDSLWSIGYSGCDSLTTLDLTLGFSSFRTDMISACSSHSWIDGNTYSSDTIVPFYLTTQLGCDSIIELNLVITDSIHVFDTITACFEYTWRDGITYMQSDFSSTYHFVDSNGCDTLFQLSLTIDTVDTQVLATGSVLSAIATNATFQWLDCGNSFSSISGQTAALFNASSNGNYAVEITQGGCTDTSDCFQVIGIGLSEFQMSGIFIYPNPSPGYFLLDVSNLGEFFVTAVDMNGKSVSLRSETGGYYYFESGTNPGIYTVRIEYAGGIEIQKITVVR